MYSVFNQSVEMPAPGVRRRSNAAKPKVAKQKPSGVPLFPVKDCAEQGLAHGLLQEGRMVHWAGMYALTEMQIQAYICRLTKLYHWDISKVRHKVLTTPRFGGDRVGFQVFYYLTPESREAILADCPNYLEVMHPHNVPRYDWTLPLQLQRTQYHFLDLIPAGAKLENPHYFSHSTSR